MEVALDRNKLGTIAVYHADDDEMYFIDEDDVIQYNNNVTVIKGIEELGYKEYEVYEEGDEDREEISFTGYIIPVPVVQAMIDTDIRHYELEVKKYPDNRFARNTLRMLAREYRSLGYNVWLIPKNYVGEMSYGTLTIPVEKDNEEQS